VGVKERVWVLGFWGLKFNPPHTHFGYGWGTGYTGYVRTVISYQALFITFVFFQ
jgi:hypothetical protein